MLTMALYHFHAAQIKRSKGQNVVASAAYRSGEKLHSDYYGEDSDYTHKGGVVCTEILLPPQAPREYLDRETLWNAVEKVEKGKKAQLAYSFDITLQNEFSMEENIALARQFLLDNFVSRGMVVDYAVHLPEREPGGIPNPHFHFMCPIRPIEKNGKWGNKQRREYVLDETGSRIPDGKGDYVFNAVPTTDWGRPETLDAWRKAWADVCNAKFAEKGLEVRIDHRTLAAQGIDRLPTVHEGPAVRQMEARGIATDKGNLNRWIRETNRKLQAVRQKINELLAWFQDKEEQPEKLEGSSLAQLLGSYYVGRNAGAYSQKAKVANLKQYSEAFAFFQEKGIVDLGGLHEYVSAQSHRMFGLNDKLREKAKEMKQLDQLLRLAQDYKRLKPIFDGIPPKGGFGKKRENYLEAHDSELRQYHAVRRKLNKENIPDGILTPTRWQEQLDALKQEYEEMNAQVGPIYQELKWLRDLQCKLDTCLHDRQKHQEIQRSQEQEL